MSGAEQFYHSKIKEYSAQLQNLKRKAIWISAARLIAFLGAGLCAWYFFHSNAGYWLIAGCILLGLFVFFVRTSADLSEKKELTGKLLFINNNETAILQGGKNQFDDGHEANDSKMHAGDLDLFGYGSLFHVLNRTVTQHGSASLASLLNTPLLVKEEIIAHHEAVKTLAPQTDLRQLITAYGLLNQKAGDSMEGIVSWIGTADKVSASKWINILRFVLPVLAVAGAFVYLDQGNSGLMILAIVCNWLVLGTFAKYTSYQHQMIGKKEEVLQQYGTILKTFAGADRQSSSILKMRGGISEHAIKEILKLSRLSSYFDQRLNLLVGFFLNTFMLYDIHVMIALEKWKKKNKDRFTAWIDTVGEIEKFNSLATFCYNHPEYVFPEVLAEQPLIRATAIGHPLIPAGRQVTNDIIAGEHEKLLLITGSNMSGKSTFLRTIGVNLLIAQCGLPVCASQFAFTPMQLLSSIRISDSLQENTSYFMAELKRLKEIISLLERDTRSLVLIDEVLRGTNSDDKTYGSEELIKKLSVFNCLAFFASHDLSLSVLEQTLEGKVSNYCFESKIENGELLFDYKLRRGVATNKNASFLMKKMGIIN